ncbi:MAG: hypothetical protein JWR60_1871 [Polaromonas sp.]|nr:hypothetical protein [Polaromonas sp.]
MVMGFSVRRVRSLQLSRPAAGRPSRQARQIAALALLTAASAFSPLSQAQAVAPNVAVPFYTPGNFMQGVYRYWYAPQAADFAAQSSALPVVLAAYCSAEPSAAPEKFSQAKARWQATAAAWDRLSGVQIGPLVLRRSARQIDFNPTRPELIARAIQAAPADTAAMERIGTPAKGLPALEWLLWTRPAAPATPACAYAVQLAQDINREAAALSTEFGQLAARDLSEEEETSVPAMSELVNQWIGGLERLRWANMEKPRLSSATGLGGGRNAPAYPRSASGQTAASWAAQWQALQALAVARTPEPALPGQGLAPLETYLRGRGLNPVASQLARSVDKADKQMRQLSPGNQTGLSAASRSLGELKKLAESDVASALQVSIGFSDADGD